MKRPAARCKDEEDEDAPAAVTSMMRRRAAAARNVRHKRQGRRRTFSCAGGKRWRRAAAAVTVARLAASAAALLLLLLLSSLAMSVPVAGNGEGGGDGDVDAVDRQHKKQNQQQQQQQQEDPQQNKLQEEYPLLLQQQGVDQQNQKQRALAVVEKVKMISLLLTEEKGNKKRKKDASDNNDKKMMMDRKKDRGEGEGGKRDKGDAARDGQMQMQQQPMQQQQARQPQKQEEFEEKPSGDSSASSSSDAAAPDAAGQEGKEQPRQHEEPPDEGEKQPSDREEAAGGGGDGKEGEEAPGGLDGAPDGDGQVGSDSNNGSGGIGGGVNGTSTGAAGGSNSPNLLFLVCDQLRYDTLGFVQRRLVRYRDKVKIRTPNIDRLAASGVWFRDAYCYSPSCAPSRASLLTGNTIRRTGIEGNKVLAKSQYRKVSSVRDRVTESESFEQILVERRAYNAESYGKWHVPNEYAYGKKFRDRRVVTYNSYDFAKQEPRFDTAMALKMIYRKALDELLVEGRTASNFASYKPGQQRNTFTGFPYTPIKADPRYGRKAETPLDERSGFDRSQMGNSNVCGVDSLPREYTTTGILGKIASKALGRMIEENQKNGVPFSLSVHFNAPHPPMVATRAFLNYYWQRRDSLLVPPTLRDTLRNTAYGETEIEDDDGKERNGKNKKKRKKKKKKKRGLKRKNFSNAEIAELTATYYGMIAEVDWWVGKLMRQLQASGLDKNTLVIFTSDHGEMLGAHGLLGKGNLLEEATRVPLIMSFPGQIREKVTVKEPVSHLDVHSTILHYLKASNLDKSDGRSLHRYIDRKYFNMNYDERVAVTEIEKVGRRSAGNDGRIPNFAIRHGDYKLILPKSSKNKGLDMMYNLRTDPLERKNLLGVRDARRQLVGKAEHLKILLIEWMRRNDGSKGYYTSPRYNVNVDQGAILEISRRRTWSRHDYWDSDGRIHFGRPVMTESGYYRRNEFFYIGRTKPGGELKITDIAVVGPHARYFHIDRTRATLKAGQHVRIKISFKSRTPVWSRGEGLHAYLQIKNSANGVRRIRLFGGKALL